MSNTDDNYEVGYRKPPKHTRFVKGQSGNPTGRPKGSKSLATHIMDAINQKVRVNTENGVRHITKLEASIMQLLNLALASKNRQAIRDVLQMVQMAEQSAENQAPISVQDQRDQPVIANIVKRIRESENAEPDAPEEP